MKVQVVTMVAVTVAAAVTMVVCVRMVLATESCVFEHGRRCARAAASPRCYKTCTLCVVGILGGIHTC